MQLLSTPQPFDDAVAWAKGRTLLPTDLDSAGLDRLSADIREVSVFSAEVTQTEVLQLIYDSTAKMVAGLSPGPGQYTSPATFVADMQALLDQIGYQAKPGAEGTIKDLRSWKRLELIADVQLRMATGFGQWKRWTDPTSMLLYPAAEFKRLEWRRVPRGSVVSNGSISLDTGRYWTDRWVAAGGRVFGRGRLLALMDDPVWVNVSRFGVPYGPPDFNSGWGRKPITRADAIKAGLLTAGESQRATSAVSPQAVAPRAVGGAAAPVSPTQPVGSGSSLLDGVKAAINGLAPSLAAALLHALGPKWRLGSDGKVSHV
jgi:hypothetical protein